jgi:FkbM family methyltransferase
MIGRRVLYANVKKFLRRRGVMLDRYSCSTSADLRLVRMLAANRVDLVLDVGANSGGYAKSLREAGYRGRILSFEPLSSAHALLTTAAGGARDWAVAPRMALGDRDSDVSINIAGNSASSSLLPMTVHHETALPESAYVGTETVEVRRLDGVRHPFLASAVTPFLKIDTQGYESQVLAGASGILPRLVGVQLEMSLRQLYEGQSLWREVIASLEAAGFELWALVPGFFDTATGRMLQCDGIFFRA